MAQLTEGTETQWQTGAASAAPSVSRRKAGVILAIILLSGLAVRLLCFSGVGISDSCRYVLAAGNAAAGEYPWQQDPGVYLRPGFVLPLVPLVAWGGYSLWTPALYNLVCSLCLIAVTYFIGQALFDRKAGLWAAAVIAASTLAVGNGTGVVPDTPQALFCALSIALVLAGVRTSGRLRVGALCLAGGAVLGGAWLTKETSVVVIPAILLIALRMGRQRVLALVCGMAGFVIVFVLEMIFWSNISGDPLQRFRALGGLEGISASDAPYLLSLWEYPTKMFLVISDDGLFYYLLVPALFWSLLCARRRGLVALAWLAVFFLFMQFGSLSISSYTPLWHQPRYLLPLVPAGAVLAGAWLCAVSREHPRIAVALFLVYAMPSLMLAYVGPAQSHTPMEAAKVAVDVLKSRQATEIYADPTLAQGMNYFRKNDSLHLPQIQRWLGDDLRPIVDFNAHPGAYVVRFDGTLRHRVADLDRFYAEIEAKSEQESAPIRYGQSQRTAMAWIWSALQMAPFPENISRRLRSALSRHLAEPGLVIYRIRRSGDHPASYPHDGAVSPPPPD